MLLHLLRHADAGDPDAWEGPDAARPLSDKGRKQSSRLGAHLAAVGFSAGAIITSPKLRASQTAEIVGKALAIPVTEDDRLAGPLDPATVDAILRDAGDPDPVVIVGHDPDFSDLLSELCGTDIAMRKGAFARLDIERPLEAGEATLRWLLPPDALKER